MSFQDLEAGHVRGAPLGGGRRNGRGAAGAGVAGAGASQAVASGVFQINTAVATFQRLVNTLGTPKDTPDLRDRMCVHPPPTCLTLPPICFDCLALTPICFDFADSVHSGFDPPVKLLRLRFHRCCGCIDSCCKWLIHRLLLPMVAWGLIFPHFLGIASVTQFANSIRYRS